MKHGIAIVGANGSGKTTLGKCLARALGYKHMDIEYYYFGDAPDSYTKSRSKDEALAHLAADIDRCDEFVLSAVNGDLGRAINEMYICVVYIKADRDVRLKRVKKRSFEKFGARMLEGGDLYESENSFFDFVATRTMDSTDQWLKSVTCPVIYVDGTLPISQNVDILQKKIAPILSKRK